MIHKILMSKLRRISKQHHSRYWEKIQMMISIWMITVVMISHRVTMMKLMILRKIRLWIPIKKCWVVNMKMVCNRNQEMRISNLTKMTRIQMRSTWLGKRTNKIHHYRIKMVSLTKLTEWVFKKQMHRWRLR